MISKMNDIKKRRTVFNNEWKTSFPWVEIAGSAGIMAEMKISDSSNISLILMEILRQIGINKKMRRRRHYIWLQDEELKTFMMINIKQINAKMYTFGSQGEGSTTPGLKSDVDFVVLNINKVAVQNVQDATYGMENFLMIADENTHLGYFKLQMMHPEVLVPLYVGDIQLPHGTALDNMGRVVLKNSEFFSVKADLIHGPAMTRMFEHTFDNDLIFGIRVYSWAQQAIPWVMRPRKSNWLTPKDFETFVQEEAILVPVGNPLSSEQSLEWRISFTPVERALMWKLNNLQMACYVLMKMIIKSFITPCLGECLSSYHCKTALFYLIDNTDKGIWKPKYLLYCLNLILKILCQWVEIGFCPNYFIPQENMFLRKMNGTMRFRLHTLLVDLIDQDFKYLTQIQFDGLGEVLYEACSRLNTTEAAFYDDRTILQVPLDKTQLGIFGVLSRAIHFTLYCLQIILKRSINTPLQCLLNTVTQTYLKSSQHLRDSLSILLPFLSSHVGCEMASSCFSDSDSLSISIAIAHGLLQLGTSSDVTSGKLKLAGFYHRMGMSAIAEVVLTVIEQDLRDYVSYVSPAKYVSLEDITAEVILREDLTTGQIFRKCVAVAVVYLPSEIHCIPSPLCFEMFWSVGFDHSIRDTRLDYWYDWAVVDARPCLYFLQYQCYSDLGKDIHKWMAIDNLQSELREERTRHPETCLNLLAYCLQQEGRMNEAIFCLFASLKLKPTHNGAMWQLCIYLFIIIQSLHRPNVDIIHVRETKTCKQRHLCWK